MNLRVKKLTVQIFYTHAPSKPLTRRGKRSGLPIIIPPGSKREKIMKSPVLLNMYYHSAFFVILQMLQ